MHNKKALIVGGTSSIAAFLAEKLALKGWEIVIEARNKSKGEAVVNHIKSLKGTASLAQGEPKEIWEDEWVKKPIDLIVIATGFLPKEPKEAALEELEETLEANCRIPMLWAELAAKELEKAGKGKIAIFGSVAGDRGRASNYIYGAAKGAIEIYSQGLAHRLHKKVEVILIKPGPTKSAMTAGMDQNGIFAEPEAVAEIIIKELEKKNPPAVIYAPRVWKLIMGIIKHLPKAVFHRTRL